MIGLSVLLLFILGSAVGFLYYNEGIGDKEGTTNDKGNETYDVVVIGGEPEGVAAAVSAARNGAKTLLVESRESLGGLFTYGMLNYLDIPQGEDGGSVSKGIFQEWHQLVGGGNAFDVTEAKAAFQKLVEEEENLNLLTSTEVTDSVVERQRVSAATLKNENDKFDVQAKIFIDATQDADFAAMSGAPYFLGGEDIGIKDRKMSVTLMIHLKNVNWEKVKETASTEKFGPATVTDQVAWGFGDLLREYNPIEENTRLRGLNIAKIDDEYFINALQIFGVDGLDEQSKQEGIERGKRETKHILSFLQQEFPGFEDAEIASFPSELYVRETRHIKAEYQLPMSDVWTNKDHWDSIALGAYPVDIQAQTPEDYGRVVAAPIQYAIPLRSIIPKEIDGLLVVGRSAGFSSLAAGSARVVPTGMAVGEGAGVVAKVAIEEEITLREMSQKETLIKEVRGRLKQQGAYVDHFELDYPYKGEWYDQSIQTLLDHGLIFGKYTNDLRVDELATWNDFIEIVSGIMERVNPVVKEQQSDTMNRINSEISNKKDNEIQRDDIASVLADLYLTEEENKKWQSLIEKGIITDELGKRIQQNREIRLKELYSIGASVIAHVERVQHDE